MKNLEETWKDHYQEEQRRLEESYTRLILAGWPDTLIKACSDPFTYALKLRDGSIIQFEHASEGINLKWAHLTNVQFLAADRLKTEFAPMTFDRGIDVRIDDIVWVADAPWGS